MKAPQKISARNATLKSIFSGLQFRCWQFGSNCICLAVVAAQVCEITRNYQTIRVYTVEGHQKSLTLVPIECTYATSYWSLIVTLSISRTVFTVLEILMHKARKSSFSDPPVFNTSGSVKLSFVTWHLGTLTIMAECQSAWMSKITNDGLTRVGTGCFIAAPIWQQWV